MENSGGLFPLVLEKMRWLDRDHIMNYESNYLAALIAAHPIRATRARIRFRADLIEVFGEDAAATYAYLETYDLFATE